MPRGSRQYASFPNASFQLVRAETEWLANKVASVAHRLQSKEEQKFLPEPSCLLEVQLFLVIRERSPDPTEQSPHAELLEECVCGKQMESEEKGERGRQRTTILARQRILPAEGRNEKRGRKRKTGIPPEKPEEAGKKKKT